MVFKNGLFKTNLTKKFQKSKFTIRMECKSQYQKELLIMLYDFVTKIDTDNIYVVIRQLQSLIFNIDSDKYRYDGCKVLISAVNNNENLYVPVI